MSYFIKEKDEWRKKYQSSLAKVDYSDQGDPLQQCINNVIKSNIKIHFPCWPLPHVQTSRVEVRTALYHYINSFSFIMFTFLLNHM